MFQIADALVMENEDIREDDCLCSEVKVLSLLFVAVDLFVSVLFPLIRPSV